MGRKYLTAVLYIFVHTKQINNKILEIESIASINAQVYGKITE